MYIWTSLSLSLHGWIYVLFPAIYVEFTGVSCTYCTVSGLVITDGCICVVSYRYGLRGSSRGWPCPRLVQLCYGDVRQYKGSSIPVGIIWESSYNPGIYCLMMLIPCPPAPVQQSLHMEVYEGYGYGISCHAQVYPGMYVPGVPGMYVYNTYIP